MKSILITGCNRGLGLGLVRHLTELPKPPDVIFATCRDISKATELVSIAEKSKRVHIIQIDLTETVNYRKLVDTISKEVNKNGLNVLFNNAGISSKYTRLGLVKEDQLVDHLFINTVAPILLAKECLPLLKQAAMNAKNKNSMSINRAAIINMSSILGSIGENDQGGFYPYRCSKAALNAATKSMSVDLKNDGILAVSLHPGWVKTDMGGTNAPLDVDTSIQNILTTLNRLNESDSGTFVQFDGKKLCW